MIQVKNLTKEYHMGENILKALDKVSFKIEANEFVSIIGASGSGKSTLMNMIGCLDKATSGSIVINNKNTSDLTEGELADFRGKTIGFIFQQYNLMPNLTVLGNVQLPLHIHDVEEEEGEAAAVKILTTLGLRDKLDSYPSQLSGGQQQRVSIARALVNNPDVILADEPTGALDSKTGSEVLKILKELWANENKTIIMITHDLSLAKNSKRIIQLRDGKVIQDTKEVKKCILK